MQARRAHDPAVHAGFGTLERDRTVGGGILAGALAYRFFLTLLPVTLLLVCGLGYLATLGTATPSDAAAQFGIKGVAASSVADSARLSSGSQLTVVILGVWALLYTSVGTARALRLVHAIAWGLPERRWTGAAPAALGYIAVIAVCLLGGGGDAWAREHLGAGGLVLTVASTALFFVVWLWASLHLPHRDGPWTLFVPGAALVAVGFQALHILTALWIGGQLAKQSAVYGALGVALVLLLWLYLLGRLIVASAALSATLWEHRSAARSEVMPPASER